MADRGPNRLAGVLLIAAAPLLVGGGLLVGTTVGDRQQPDQQADSRVASAGDERVASFPVAPPTTSPTGHPASPAARAVLGVRPEAVVVPALDVHADVLPIATEDGALNPPSDPRSVGWWSGGSRAGAGAGAAVITGHTVHTGGGAFDDLEQLTAGDRVLVLTARGSVAYDVAFVRVLSRTELARESTRIFGRSGPGRLVLITCEDWDGTAYRSNVVVTARPVTT